MIDIRKILEAGQAALDKAHAEKEKELAGKYRVGSAGAVTGAGAIHGTCHRIAMARNMGIEKPTEESQKILFAAGEGNESHVWHPRLVAGFTEGVVLSHDEIKVDYLLPNGKQVIGHPDKVLADKDRKPLVGIELKGCFSYGTTVQVYCEGQPKNENLIQAAAYSLMLGGLPYVLAYTNHSWWKLDYYDKKKYPLKNIKPFDRMFYLRWTNDVLEYRDERKSDWVTTSVTKQGVIDFYLLVQEMQDKKDLGPRVNSHYVNGNENKWGAESACGICDFRHACDSYDTHKSFDRWIEDAKQMKDETNE